MAVDRCALADQRVDVRHRHQQLDAAVRQHFAGGELVKVERVVVVERTPGQSDQIADARVAVATRAADAGQLLHGGTRQGRLETAVKHRLHRDARQIGPA